MSIMGQSDRPYDWRRDPDSPGRKAIERRKHPNQARAAERREIAQRQAEPLTPARRYPDDPELTALSDRLMELALRVNDWADAHPKLRAQERWLAENAGHKDALANLAKHLALWESGPDWREYNYLLDCYAAYQDLGKPDACVRCAQEQGRLSHQAPAVEAWVRQHGDACRLCNRHALVLEAARARLLSGEGQRRLE